jgi:phage terminase large subunit-like protein
MQKPLMLNSLSYSEKQELIALLEAKERIKSQNRLLDYRPYKKQLEFHEAGKTFRERMLMAGNQLGKTFSAAAEVAYHMTGGYPDWWVGYRFDRPNNWLAGSESGELTKKGVQRLLFGRDIKNALGTGMIPADCIEGYSPARGVPELIDSARIKHVSGGISTIALKSYEQGRGKWQADTVDGVWFDEEPPLDIYTEGLTRTNVVMGLIILTETPLLGMSDTVMRFIGDTKAPNTHVTVMTIDDAEHYTSEQREAIIASYPAHEREARTKGIPMLGSGRIFPFTEEALSIAPFEIPKHWAQIGGLDFGYDHPFAGVKLAWDRDSDTVYVTKTYRIREASPTIHAAALKPWGDWIPWSWPHDGLQHDKGGSCEQLMAQYKAQGLNMLPDRATFPDGTNGVEAGIMDMYARMETKRLRVFSTETEWFEEFRMYHRKDGKIVKERDDLLSATRYGIMMLRFADVKRSAQPIKYKSLGTV